MREEKKYDEKAYEDPLSMEELNTDDHVKQEQEYSCSTASENESDDFEDSEYNFKISGKPSSSTQKK